MGVWFFVMCSLICILLHPSVSFSETSPEIELANAKVIVDLDNQVTAVTMEIKNATSGTDLTSLKNKLKAKQEALDLAVKAAYALPTNEGVKQAKKLAESATVIEDLNKTLVDPNVPEAAKDVIRNARMLAEDRAKELTKDTNESQRLKDLADKRFAGFGFGVALGVTVKAGKRQIVNSATVDPNGLVRIDRDNNTTANFILESHYFFTPDIHIPIFNVEPKNWGTGPFIAVQPGTENIIQAVGAGWMIGFKRSSIIASDLARDRGDSFNLGFGIMLNPNAQVLGDGIEKDKPLPGAETAIRLKKTTELGWLFTFSYSF
ncbi:MAG: hypothetical protein HOO98_20310 [Nitrospira sp.]|nr:hypothetical protein [Nitrospira sp.]